MDKEILKRYDDLIEDFKQVGGHTWEVYVKGVFVESLLYTISGLVIICAAIILGAISYKLMNKKVYEREELKEVSAMNGEARLVEGEPIRDTDKEDVYAFLGVIIGVAALIIIGVGFMIFYQNVIGIFAPEYEGIRRIIESVKEIS